MVGEPGSASRGWSRRRSRRSRRGSCAAAAFPTGRGSPTGRSWRWSSSWRRCRRSRPPRRRSARCWASRMSGRAGTRSPGRSASCSRSRRRSSWSSTTSSGASETFLDLVESTALLSAGAPLLLLCMARPELVERRPAWPATLRLEPLPPEQADALIGDSVSEELRERIARAAGGNPLFISEMLAMAAEERGGRGASDAEGAAGGPARPARRAGAQGARARLGRG